ncbi:MAG: LuxE/PaaK family acyltransferase [Candidatus Helarchaeota archaeon]
MKDYLPNTLQTKYFEFQKRKYTDDLFLNELYKQVKISIENCKFYRENVCQQFDFTLPDQIKMENLVDIPYISTNLFKESRYRFLDLLKVPIEHIILFSSSSSTTGDPSIIPRTLEDFDQIQYNSIKVFTEFFRWNDMKNCLMFNFAPSRSMMAFMARMKIQNKEFKKRFGNRVRYFTACMNKPWEYYSYQEYLIKFKLFKTLWSIITSFDVRGGFILDVSLMLKMIHKVLDTNQWKGHEVNKICFGGSPLLMNNMFKKRLLKEDIVIDLSDRGFVGTGGGGWDGVKGQAKLDAVNKVEFVANYEKVFGIKSTEMKDIYAFTEGPNLFGGHWSEKYQDYLLHCPDTARIIVRDIDSLEPLKTGEGLLETITPFGVNGCVNQAVLIDDIVEIISLNKCPECGYEGATFRIIGRLKDSQGRGCSSIIDWIH